MRSWEAEYRRSMKSREIEDKIDLLFYRPLGFLCAKAAQQLGLSPTQVTLGGMLVGAAAGFLFSLPGSAPALAAGVLFLFSGVLDSADGQLARITGRSTALGLVLDGLCDNVVFVAVYVGCAWPIASSGNPWIWPLAVLAGLCHSCQSALLDLYLRDYLFFTGTKSRDQYWNPSPSEAASALRSSGTAGDRWLWRLRITWLFQQQVLSVRGAETRKYLRERSEGEAGAGFRALYRKHNLPILRLWRPLGANVHTIGILVFSSLGRFDLYLWLVDLLGLNLLLAFASLRQRSSDRRLMAAGAALSRLPLDFPLAAPPQPRESNR